MSSYNFQEGGGDEDGRGFDRAIGTIGAAGAFKTIVLVYFYIGFYIRNKNVPGAQYVEVLIPNAAK